jgi:hypothetical protein
MSAGSSMIYASPQSPCAWLDDRFMSPMRDAIATFPSMPCLLGVTVSFQNDRRQ